MALLPIEILSKRGDEHSLYEIRDRIRRIPASIDARKHAARRYYDIDNPSKEYSRRQFQELLTKGIRSERLALSRKQGKQNVGGSAKTRAYSRLVNTYKQHVAEKENRKASSVRVRGDSAEAKHFREWAKKLTEFNKKNSKIKPHDRTREQNNELIKILEELKLRTIGETYIPSESPTGKRSIPSMVR